MINKIKVVNSYGEELTMTLKEPQLSGYAITDVSGIGPTDVEIKQTQFVSGRKYKYNAGFHKYREINLNIIYYEWNDLLMKVDQLRNNLYKYFKTNDKITLYFEKDDIQYAIEGYVSKHDAVVWSQNCGAKITVLCPDPWFRKFEINYLNKDISIWFENLYANICNVIYDGDISTGFRLITNSNITDMLGQTITLTNIHFSGNTRSFILNIPSSIDDASTKKLVIDLLSDVINVYTVTNSNVITKCNGWIDATTITKRQELPEILPGINEIRLVSSNYSQLSFNIEYNTLNRGL